MTGRDPVLVQHGVWTLHDYAVVGSTNLVAAGLPPWTAVRAKAQTAGRGRFQRRWISDEGGLWLSAVLPGSGPAFTRGLPLLAGIALWEVARVLGVGNARLRWPNDLLSGNRKLAGILLDQFNSETVVLGLGINVYNQPEARDVTLRQRTARLVDLVPNPPDLLALTLMVLDAIEREWHSFKMSQCALPLQRLNQCWGAARQVELDLDGPLSRGMFTGVDDQGRLSLLDSSGTVSFYSAHQVRHLTELES